MLEHVSDIDADAAARGELFLAESQELAETIRLAPRAGVAWSPSAKRGTVVRAGFGLFYDRVPLNVYAFDHHLGDSEASSVRDRLAEVFFRHLDCGRRGVIVIAGP